MSNTGAVLRMAKSLSFDSPSNTAVQVRVRLMFLRIGEIDTLNEKYQAQAAIEARWPIDIDKLTAILPSSDQKNVLQGKSVSLVKYAESHWHPQLFIENALGELKEQIRYSVKRASDQQFYICEHRDVKGIFWEKLELQHFPSDIQDLSISVGSMFYDDKVLLIADPRHASGINREAFVDQQEWFLYQHVDTQQRFVKEFLFDTDDDDEQEEAEENEETKLTTENVNEARSDEIVINPGERKRSILTITCHAARQSNYFYWNGYCLILLITMVSYAVFSIPPHFVANRIQTSCTLLLTSITFRWTVNRSLPTISYLTSMDKYAILCIFNLIFLCSWHAAIGALVFAYTPDFRTTYNMWLAQLDRYVFLVTLTIFIFLQFALITWLFFVPLKYRRQMANKDLQYQKSLSAKKSTKKELKKKKTKNVEYTPAMGTIMEA